MPVAPRVRRVTPRGVEDRPNANLIRWWYAPQDPQVGVYREDWFDPRDVLDHQPDAGEWAALVGRGVLG